jgi:antitoxin MazE
VALRANLVRIGNSRGIRIPKSLIDECHLGDTVELSVVDGSLVVRPAAAPRQGWDAAFERMAEAGDDTLVDPEIPTEFDTTEWECQGRRYPTRVAVNFRGAAGQVVLDQIRTVDKVRLVRRLGVLNQVAARRVLDVLAEMFAP